MVVVTRYSRTGVRCASSGRDWRASGVTEEVQQFLSGQCSVGWCPGRSEVVF